MTGRLIVVGMVLMGTLRGSDAAQPISEVHAVVDLEVDCLLGGTVGAAWMAPAEIAERIHGGERYSLYSAGRSRGESNGGKAEAVGPPCRSAIAVAVPTPDLKERDGLLAVGGTWAALPRPVRTTEISNPVYRDAAAQILKESGGEVAAIELRQVLRVDLDGDGVEEVVVTAVAKRRAIVFLRTLVAGKVRSVVLASDPPETTGQVGPSHLRVAGVVDVDGDSRMEIVLHGELHDEAWSRVYRVEGTTARQVAVCGCGG